MESLTFAVGPYDRVMPLFDGTVSVPGVRFEPKLIGTPVELFSRMIAHGEFHIAEMSLTHCFVLQSLGKANFVTVPVFPSRMFRHGFIFVHRDAGIRSPRDLAGKRIGVQGHQMTAAVWIRGMLREQHGVSFDGVQWWEGGVNSPGVSGGNVMQLRPRRGLDVQAAPAGTTLSDLLARGEIDALIGAFIPKSFGQSPQVLRLFPDHVQEERSYFRQTGIFPIMHALAIRRDVMEAHPGLPKALVGACTQAQEVANQRIRYSAALSVSLPWILDHAAETDQAVGGGFWKHGLRDNRDALLAFSRMLVADGYLDHEPALESILVT